MKKASLLYEVCRECKKPCCKQEKGTTFGTMLSPEEKSELESNCVRPVTIEPMVAVPMKREKKIILYQLLHAGECCPALSQNGLCTIYPRRPLMCRAYPFFGPLLSKACPYSSYYKRNERRFLDLYIHEKRSALILGRMFLTAMQTEEALVYLYIHNEWIKASDAPMDVRQARWYKWKAVPNFYL